MAGESDKSGKGWVKGLVVGLIVGVIAVSLVAVAAAFVVICGLTALGSSINNKFETVGSSVNGTGSHIELRLPAEP